MGTRLWILNTLDTQRTRASRECRLGLSSCHSCTDFHSPDPRLSPPPPLNSPQVQSPVELPSENGQEGTHTQIGNEQRHS